MSAFLVLLLSISARAAEPGCLTDHIDAYGVVKEIYDGDTLRLTDNRKIRFIGVNTPELAHDEKPVEPLAVIATEKLSELIPPGSRIGLRYGKSRKDRYRRTLAHVFRHDGLNVTAEMIKQGYGFAIVVPPNDWQSDCYFRTEQQARNSSQGIWANPYYKVRDVTSLSKTSRGFMRVTGKVTRVGKSKKNIWLDMGRAFSVKLPRKHIQSFEGVPINSLQGKQITVRGWVSYYNDKLRVSLGHPAMMEIME